MYADDLVLISRTKEGLQRQIDSLHEYSKKWKLDANTDKTKTMIFNRENTKIKANFDIGGIERENVKLFEYLGFTINAKNHSFQNTIDDLTTKASRAIFAIKKDDILGKLTISYKDEIIEEHDLLAFEDIKKLNIFSRLIKSINFLIWGDV